MDFYSFVKQWNIDKATITTFPPGLVTSTIRSAGYPEKKSQPVVT